MYYRLYQVNNSKKSAVRGYWADKGKIYADNIQIKRYTRRTDLEKSIKGLFNSGEKAVFYRQGLSAIIQDRQGKKVILRHRQVYRRIKLSTQEIKGFIKQYGGLTIYNNKKSRGLYFIEIWQKGGELK